MEFAALDRSNPTLNETVVRSYASYAEAEEQVGILNRVSIAAVHARAVRAHAVDQPSARLVFEMVQCLIDPLGQKLNEADERGREALAALHETDLDRAGSGDTKPLRKFAASGLAPVKKSAPAKSPRAAA
jgi:hypothetical protein